MGYFAIAHLPGKTIPQVERCHLNLFVLSTSPDNMFFDVGILFAKPDHPHEDFQVRLALPFGTDAGAAEDLSLLVPESAVLIFGEPVIISEQTLTISSYGDSIQVVNVTDIKREESCAAEDGSVWTFTVHPDSSRRSYIRLRFRVDIHNAVWSWIPTPFTRDAAIVDFRVNDVRSTIASSVQRSNWAALGKHIVGIAHINLFIITPTDFHAVRSSPPSPSIRLLERSAWNKYIQRVVKSQLLATHFKVLRPNADDAIRESRVFVEYRRPPQAFGLRDSLKVTLTLCVALLAFVILSKQPHEWSAFIGNKYALTKPHLVAIVAFATAFQTRYKLFLGIFDYLHSNIGIVRGLTRWLNNQWRQKPQ